MRYIWRALLLLAVGAAMCSTEGLAAEPQTGPYIGAGVGQARYKDACADIPAIAASLGVSSTCDERDTAYKIYGGYRFTPNLAAELGFTKPGKTKATVGAASAELKAWLVPVYAVGIVPLFDDRLWLMAKAGGVYWNAKLNASSPVASISNSDNGVAFAYGAGVQYNFTPQLGVRAEYEVFHNVGKEDTTGKGDIRMWTVGAVWQF
jgi:OOP family OmpA-OmpF porin